MADIVPDDKPLPGGHDDRAWEEVGAVRRDCEPHRGHLLHFLSMVALFVAVLSLSLPVCPLPALLSLALGSGIYYAAWRDLLQMEQGDMDPSGRPRTLGAQKNSRGAIVCSLVAALVSGVLFAVVNITDFGTTTKTKVLPTTQSSSRRSL